MCSYVVRLVQEHVCIYPEITWRYNMLYFFYTHALAVRMRIRMRMRLRMRLRMRSHAYYAPIRMRSRSRHACQQVRGARLDSGMTCFTCCT